MNDRRAPGAAVFVDLRRFLAQEILAARPLARLLVEGDDERVQPRSEIENDQVVIDDRAAAKAPDVLDLAKVLVPQDFAREVIGIDAGRAIPGDDALAIAHGRGRAERIGVVRQLFRGIFHLMLPEQLAGAAVIALQAAETGFGRRVRD